MTPVLGGEVIEGEQGVPPINDLGHRLGPLLPKLIREGLDGRLSVPFVLGTGNLMNRRLSPRVDALGHGVEFVGGFMDPIPLVAGLGNTSRTALQNPRAPSPTVNSGALIPRFLRSRSRQAQLSVDSR